MPSLPAKGSRWYVYGRHIEVVEVFYRDGEHYVRERDTRTKQKLPPVPLSVWAKRAIEEE